ncbi:MAG: HPr family phosphocarrier protein [Planctomycetota bacterium]
MRLERNITIENDNGLHARPAMQFVDCANNFTADIRVVRAPDHPDGPAEADAKSVMQMLTLAATKGTVLTLVADGEDAEEALDQLEKMVQSKFGEES